MWQVKVFDSFNSDMVYYKWDEPLPYKLSLDQMRVLLVSCELILHHFVDGVDYPINLRVTSRDSHTLLS